jgi:hypothetical protein
MAITLSIPSEYFTARETDRMKALLYAKTDGEFARTLEGVVLAALDEYRDMFLGLEVPARMDDIRQHRLFHLIKRLFLKIPDERRVGSLFQLSETRSRALITNTLARFRNDLEEEIHVTIREILAAAESLSGGQKYKVYAPSRVLVDEMDRIIAAHGVRFQELTRVQGESNAYHVAPDSYTLLCDQLGVTPVPSR